MEIPDEELQDECLQIRIMDYDRYSADDQIGKVYLNLSSLLLRECGHQMYGQFFFNVLILNLVLREHQRDLKL